MTHHPPDNFLALNSLAFFRWSYEVMDSYGKKQLCLDTDAAGRSATAEAQARSNSYDRLQSYLYSKQLPELLVHAAGASEIKTSGTIIRKH